MRRKLFAGLLAALVMVSMVATPAAAALAFGDSGAPNPYIDADTTIDSYDASWGDNLQYADDSGETQNLPAKVNKSNDVDDIGAGTVNPYTYTATDVAADDFGEFPRNGEDDNAASALDASEWSSDLSGSAGTGSVSDVETAPGVDAVRLQTSSQASGDTAIFTYSNFTVTSDENKRFLQLAADINTLDSGTVAEVRVVDEDGDYKSLTIDTGANQSDAGVLANQTGEGHVSQQQLGDLTTQGTGDGTFNNIEKIEVHVNDGNLDAEFSLVNAEKMGAYDFGEKRVDNDDDGEFETVDHTEPHGEISVHSMETLGDTVGSATIMGLTVPVHYQASDLGDSDMSSAFEEASSYPGFDILASIYYKLELPGAYDLSHSNAVLKTTTQWPGERYVTVELKEDAGDTDFEDIENWNDQTSTHDSQDKDITLDSTIQSDTEYALHYELKLTDSEADGLQQATSSGAGGGLFSSGGGGIIGFFTSLPGMILGGIGAFAGGRKLGVF